MATVEELKKELFYKPQHASAVVEENEVAKADAFAEDYFSLVADVVRKTNFIRNAIV